MASELATSAFQQGPSKFQIAAARLQDSAPKPREPPPPPRRTESPTRVHRQVRGPLPASTNETAAPGPCRSALIAERSCPESPSKATQQFANIPLAVRCMTAV